MSRIGKAPIAVPKGVEVKINNGIVAVKGAKGELTQKIEPGIIVAVEDGHVVLSRSAEQKRLKALHGLYRSLIQNMVKGVSEGYRTEQELVA
jgi:large subunit ribosomal protein L6